MAIDPLYSYSDCSFVCWMLMFLLSFFLFFLGCTWRWGFTSGARLHSNWISRINEICKKLIQTSPFPTLWFILENYVFKDHFQIQIKQKNFIHNNSFELRNFFLLDFSRQKEKKKSSCKYFLTNFVFQFFFLASVPDKMLVSIYFFFL